MYFPYKTQEALTTDLQAIAIDSYLTTITNATTSAYAYTLASGVAINQYKKIVLLASTSTVVITADFEGATTTKTLLFGGDTLELVWSGLEWKTIASYNYNYANTFSVRASLTAAQLKTGQTVPIVAASAPGSGYGIEVVSASGKYVKGNGLLSATDLILRVDTADAYQYECYIDPTISQFMKFSPRAITAFSENTIVDNKALTIATDANSAAGTGTAIIYIQYRIITI